MKNQDKNCLLFQALTANDINLFPEIESLFERYYGSIYLKGDIFRFDTISSYYQEEMGETLFKCFYVFKPLVHLENFYRFKVESQSIEKMYSRDGDRCVNIDPGALNLYQLSLLTTKAFSHRTYLAEGIYAEVTLMASKDKFIPLPWTYPDYKIPKALEFFAQAKKYLKKVKSEDRC